MCATRFLSAHHWLTQRYHFVESQCKNEYSCTSILASIPINFMANSTIILAILMASPLFAIETSHFSLVHTNRINKLLRAAKYFTYNNDPIIAKQIESINGKRRTSEFGGYFIECDLYFEISVLNGKKFSLRTSRCPQSDRISKWNSNAFVCNKSIFHGFE